MLSNADMVGNWAGRCRCTVIESASCYSRKSEMSSLKADNERLQRVISQRGLDPSLVASGRFPNALENELSPESNRHSLAELPASGTSLPLY